MENISSSSASNLSMMLSKLEDIFQLEHRDQTCLKVVLSTAIKIF